MSSKHTPLPWRLGLGYEQSEPGVYITGANGLIVASDDTEPSQEDAALIVRACNSHELMVEALQAFLAYANKPSVRIGDLGLVAQVNAALAAAEAT